MSKILAIDPATVTGWAIDGKYGTWNLKTLRDESWGMKILRFRSKLEEIYQMFPYEVIAFERPAGFHKVAIISHSKLVGEIESFCTSKKIDYIGFSASEIKKFATGKGNASKSDMVKAARLIFDDDKLNDNEADALFILELAKKRLKL